MPAKTVKLTQSRIDALQPPARGEYAVHDREAAGLALRVRAGGSMTWMLRYRAPSGQARRLTLGDARKVNLKDARAAARIAWGERAKGADPQAERGEAARRKRAQLGSCVDAYVKDLARIIQQSAVRLRDAADQAWFSRGVKDAGIGV
jgi:hypothetical protein